METLANLLGPLHPPMTHFPIVCSILAVLALGWGMFKKEDWALKAAGALWFFSFLTAIPSVLLGHFFAHSLGMYSQWTFLPPDNVMKGQLRFHAILGSSGLALSFFTLWSALRLLKGENPTPKLQLLLGFAVAALFGLAGHEGGEMTYGEEKGPTPSTSAVTTTSDADILAMLKDYRKALVKVNAKTWNSRTHGHRWVDTYVSKEAVEAYKNSDELPQGTWVVKDSTQDQGGKASDVPGPIYLMFKGKAADSIWTNGWKFAMTWEKPVAGNPENLQAPVTWLPGDAHLASCVKCHNHFKSADEMGGVPDEALAP